MAERDETKVPNKRHSKGKNKPHKDKTLDEDGSQGGMDNFKSATQISRTSENSVTSKNQTVSTVETAEKSVQNNNATTTSKVIENKVDHDKSGISKKTEKTREEILAEREAKKLAKQALKKKAKDGQTDKAKSNVSECKKDVLQPEGKENHQDKAPKSEKSPAIKTPDVINHVETQSKDIKQPDTEAVGDIKSAEGKTKSQLRAERRAKQEAQRAKKLEKAKEIHEVKSSPAIEVPKPEKIVPKVAKVVCQPQDKTHKVKLFAHLYRDVFDCVEMLLAENLHPCIVRLGTQYRSKVISGANARCLALLNAFKTVLNNFTTPPNQEFSRGLEAEITKSMIFLNKCRPVAVSMTNAVKHLKYQVNQLNGNEIESKKQINDWIDTYIKEQIEKAAEAISLFVLEKITDGDVILTYSCSSLIQRALIKANEAKIKFRVIVVDGRPWLEGKEMLRRLVKAGISCTYVFFNGLSFIMPEVTKILLGAHALLANGYVMSRAGSSQIALLAKTYNVPVLVCCETHKFSEKVQTDSFVHNELGDPDNLISGKGCISADLSKWRTMQYLTPLNLTYDVTPPDLVSAVVTELAVLPCTSVPVILRVKPPDWT